MRAKLSLFIRNSQIEYQTEQLLLEKCFDLLLSLESDEWLLFYSWIAYQNEQVDFDFDFHFHFYL